jgi:dihydrofolate reductase
MNCELIVCCTKDGIIGNNNTIPWHIPEDLKYFRNTTINNIVIMGRKTYKSLPNGYLNNRMNIVITSKYLDYKNNTNIIFTNMDNIISIIEKLQKDQNRKIFIIGGSEIYRLFFDYCDTIHLTVINNNILGDITFPYNITIFTEPKYELLYKSDKLNFNHIVYQRFIYKKK